MSDLRTIAVENAPKAIGPYAQGIAAGGFLFTAGQTPLDPATMKLVEGDVAAQTARVLDNLAAVLAGAGPRSRTSSGPESSSWTWPISRR